MSLYEADSQEPLAICSRVPAAPSSPSPSLSPSRSPHAANANNNSNAHNAIKTRPSSSVCRSKAGVMLNGGMNGIMEEEEEREKTTSSISIIKEHPGHLQELHPDQFPMSGDLPTLDSGIPSSSLGFDLSSCSEHEGTGSPPISPNSPSSASYDSNKLDSSVHSSHLTSTPSPSPTLTNSPSLPYRTVIHPSPTILTSATSPLPPPSYIFSHSLSPGTSSLHSTTPERAGSEPHQERTTQEGEGGESDMDQGMFRCQWDECNMEFPLLSGLVAHLDRAHTATMVTYRCLWKGCPRNKKSFDARYKLITHLRCHTGEKPYKCDVQGCTRSFSRLENLKLHVRTHTGEKPYACHYDKCTKRFNNTSDRAKHMKTHIIRKPYACKIPGCGKSYTDPSSMRKHVKFAHKARENSNAESSGSISWSRRPVKRSSSPISLSTTPLLNTGNTTVSRPNILHQSISSLATVTTRPFSLSLPNKMSVIQSDVSSPSPSIHSLSSSSPSLSIAPSTLHQATAQMVGMSPSRTSTASMLPLSVVQVPGSGPSLVQQPPSALTFAAPGMQSVMMQVDNSEHKMMFLVPTASLPNAVSNSTKMVVDQKEKKETSGSNSLPDAMSPYTQLVSVDPSQVAFSLPLSEAASHTRLVPSQPTMAAASNLPSHQQESELIEQQVRLQVAHLQCQLMNSQSPRPQPHSQPQGNQVKSQTTTQPLPPVYLSMQLPTEPQHEAKSAPLSVALSNSSLKLATVAPAKADTTTLPMHVLPSQQQVQGGPVVLSNGAQGLLLNSFQTQVVGNVLPSAATQYIQPAGLVQLSQVPGLASPLTLAAATKSHTPTLPPSGAHLVATTTTSDSSAKLTVKPLSLAPTQYLNFGAPAVVLQGGQLLSVVPSIANPQVLVSPVAPAQSSKH